MDETYYQLPIEQLGTLLDSVVSSGYRLYVPTISESAVVYREYVGLDALPRGYQDSLDPARYRLQQASHQRYFSYTNTVQSLKPLLFRPRERLWQSQRCGNEIRFQQESDAELAPIAVLGVRACDLAALKLQDAHFLSAQHIDPFYARQRDNLLIIAVDCNHSAATCFCDSTGDGPAVRDMADIVVSELDDGFLLRSLSAAGEKLVSAMQLAAAAPQNIEAANNAVEQARQQQQRRLSANLTLAQFSDNSEGWDSLQEQCLSCGNCTSVCPTCYCHSEFDELDLALDTSTHYRQWSSCFTDQHSYMHGIVIRPSTALRYKQWITHKLVHWKEQYGRSGCVGCGRCIAWCPVGIDITAVAHTLTSVSQDE